MAAPKLGDVRAGFTGLIVGAVLLLLILGGIVKLTNAHYAGKAEATTSQH